jgi:uncharacterized protein YjiS (DUF1127 family)
LLKLDPTAFRCCKPRKRLRAQAIGVAFATHSFSLLQTAKAFARASDWGRFRNTLSQLDELDEHMLRDIGLTRDDIIDLRLASSGDEKLGDLTRRRASR